MADNEIITPIPLYGVDVIHLTPPKFRSINDDDNVFTCDCCKCNRKIYVDTGDTDISIFFGTYGTIKGFINNLVFVFCPACKILMSNFENDLKKQGHVLYGENDIPNIPIRRIEYGQRRITIRKKSKF
jgi:hypothetical protein